MREDDIMIIYSQPPNALSLNEQTRAENIIYMIYSSSKYYTVGTG